MPSISILVGVDHGLAQSFHGVCVAGGLLMLVYGDVGDLTVLDGQCNL